jgi:hypothetical protein
MRTIAFTMDPRTYHARPQARHVATMTRARPRATVALMQPTPPYPPRPTDCKLHCRCGKEVSGPVREGPSWDQMAELAQRYGWLPVVAGFAVGASAGTHFYACSPSCQTEWLASLK